MCHWHELNSTLHPHWILMIQQDGWMGGIWMDGWMNGLLYKWVNGGGGWNDEWIDGQMDG